MDEHVAAVAAAVGMVPVGRLAAVMHVVVLDCCALERVLLWLPVRMLGVGMTEH